MIRKRQWHVRNKWKRHLGLAGRRPISRHLPPTRLLGPQTLRQFLDRYPIIYVKPVFGSYGNNIIRIRKVQDRYEVQRESRIVRVPPERIVQTVYRHVRRRPYMIQRGIPLITVKGRPVDFRVLLLRPNNHWEVMGTMGKVATGNRIVTNYNHGGRPIRLWDALIQAGWSADEVAATRERMHRICLAAARIFNSRYKHCRRLGFDLAIDRNPQIWILEVNTNPYYELYRFHEDRTLYRKIHRYMQQIRRIQTDRW